MTQPTSTAERRSTLSLIVVSSGLVLAALPLFMVGGLAVQIRGELGFSESALGAAVTTGFVVGAVSAPFGGRLADRTGPKTALYIGSSLSAISLIGLGAFADGWGLLVIFLALAGLAVAITDPGLAILVNSTVSKGKHGLAFGLKEASIPAATLAAGAAVPAIALTVGWRWAFAVGALPLLVVVLVLSRIEQGPDPDFENSPEATVAGRTAKPPGSAILLTAVAAALGTAAASGVGVFLTESAVAMGVEPGTAGILLAAGSVAGIITRISTGMSADRTGGAQFRLIALMLAIGGVTIALGGTGNDALLVVGTIGAFTGGWGWTGLYFLSLVKASPSNPGAVSGIGTSGLGVGNAVGPLLFGITAESISFRAAWLGAGIVAIAGALVMLIARSRMDLPSRGETTT
jgi:predicted MFS family arabinose efflux permease